VGEDDDLTAKVATAPDLVCCVTASEVVLGGERIVEHDRRRRAIGVVLDLGEEEGKR
jgi:hypothetical protein